MNRNLFVGICLGLIATGTALAMSGNDLKKACLGDKASGVGADAFCDGYIQGATDAYLTPSSPKKPTVFAMHGVCPPTAATYDQARAIMTKYLSDHPEDLHYSAASLLTFAMRQAFPCPK